MSRIKETIVYLEEQIALWKSDLDDLESGRFQIFDLRDGGRVDVTPERIADIKRRKAGLERTVAAYRELPKKEG